MAEPPGQAVLDDIGDVVAAGRNRGNRRPMSGLKRVLHAQQKAQPQYCKHDSRPGTDISFETYLSLSGGKLERKSGLGYAEPASPDGAAFQVVGAKVRFVAGGTKGDAEAPFVLNSEIRGPAASLQGAATGRIGKAGISRPSRGELRHCQRRHQDSGKWPLGRHRSLSHG